RRFFRCPRCPRRADVRQAHGSPAPMSFAPTDPARPEYLPAPASPPAGLPDDPGRRLLAAFLGGRSGATLRSYAGDLRDFAAFAGAASPEAAALLLLGRGPGRANEAALAYRAHLLGRGLSPSTVNRRLAALRSLVKVGRTLGLVTWGLEVEGVP